MADRKKDPLTNFHFYVDIESVFAGTFREVSGLTTENPVIEYWHAGPAGDTRYLKMPGRLKVNDITMKTGTIDDTLSLHKWRKEIEAGQVVCEIGIAPVKPAEFVVFRLSQFSAGGTSEIE